MKQIIKETVVIYNEKKTSFIKPYANITPGQKHQQDKVIMRTYKTKNSIKNVFDAV